MELRRSLHVTDTDIPYDYFDMTISVDMPVEVGSFGWLKYPADMSVRVQEYEDEVRFKGMQSSTKICQYWPINL